MTSFTHGGRPQESAGDPTLRASAAAAAVAALVVGFLPASVTFVLNPGAATDIGLAAVPIPAWFFVAVWLVIYPCMGVSAWLLWQQRAVTDVSVPLAVLAAGFVQTCAFWLTDGLRTTALLDAIGVLLAGTTVWVVSRYSRRASRWLIPWLVWMPITLLIKIAALSGVWKLSPLDTLKRNSPHTQ